MSWIDYSDIAVLIEETLKQNAAKAIYNAYIEINNMLYRELVFPVFKTTNTGALLNTEFWFYFYRNYF